MTTKEVGTELTALVRQGKFEEAVTRFYSPEIISVEAGGPQPEARGIAAVQAKGEWWDQNFQVHEVTASEPYVNGDQFAVLMKLDVTEKANGKRYPIEEVAVYTVADGKIVHERFFYDGEAA